MTQFASTLYPQTNPTNPILLEFREVVRDYRDHEFPLAVSHWLRYVDGYTYGWSEAQKSHARRVLTRLAALTG